MRIDDAGIPVSLFGADSRRWGSFGFTVAPAPLPVEWRAGALGCARQPAGGPAQWQAAGGIGQGVVDDAPPTGVQAGRLG